jgi:hypothetical protein
MLPEEDNKKTGKMLCLKVLAGILVNAALKYF